ncbi:hypothetical protein P4O66_000539 [Electrophorus voltai]|uniref:Uncharacterized protein n=1 Tax=Electrophorus voltai TaxID=2609070 RepID=A0AAD8ZGI7_9TELE|nr:hypothetical protein P4O66_000539 [Electrophorus voltai]
MAGIVYRNICAKYGLEVPRSNCDIPPKVVENYCVKILWDFQIQADKMVMANQLDIVFVDKQQKSAVVIDVSIPSDCNIRKKEHKKLEEYQGLKEEAEKMWRVKATVVPMLNGKKAETGEERKETERNGEGAAMGPLVDHLNMPELRMRSTFMVNIDFLMPSRIGGAFAQMLPKNTTINKEWYQNIKHNSLVMNYSGMSVYQESLTFTRQTPEYCSQNFSTRSGDYMEE